MEKEGPKPPTLEKGHHERHNMEDPCDDEENARPEAMHKVEARPDAKRNQDLQGEEPCKEVGKQDATRNSGVLRGEKVLRRTK